VGKSTHISVELDDDVFNFMCILEEKWAHMKKNEYFMMLYVGETCQTFEMRMADKNPKN
jgi:hypothetical protein